MDYDELKAIYTAHPYFIPITVAAGYLHVQPSALRASIEQGRCPFGFSWRQGDRQGFKIPTIAFVSWLTKGTLPS